MEHRTFPNIPTQLTNVHLQKKKKSAKKDKRETTSGIQWLVDLPNFQKVHCRYKKVLADNTVDPQNIMSEISACTVSQRLARLPFTNLIIENTHCTINGTHASHSTLTAKPQQKKKAMRRSHPSLQRQKKWQQTRTAMCQLNALNMCKSTLHHNQEWSHQEPREVVRNSSPKSFCRRRRLRFSQIYALRHTAWPLHHVFHIVKLRDNMSHHQCAAGGLNSTASRIDVVNLFKCPVATKTNSETQKPSSPRPTWRVKMKCTGSLPHLCALAATLRITTKSLQKQTTTPDIIEHVPSPWSHWTVRNDSRMIPDS